MPVRRLLTVDQGETEVQLDLGSGAGEFGTYIVRDVEIELEGLVQ